MPASVLRWKSYAGPHHSYSILCPQNDSRRRFRAKAAAECRTRENFSSVCARTTDLKPLADAPSVLQSGHVVNTASVAKVWLALALPSEGSF